VGKQGRGREAAGEYPYPTAVLLRHLVDSREQRRGELPKHGGNGGGGSFGARVSRAEAAAAA
jgi:hypothetical protein